jgi:hypothetical protein
MKFNSVKTKFLYLMDKGIGIVLKGRAMPNYDFESARVQALGLKLLPPSKKINNSLKS